MYAASRSGIFITFTGNCRQALEFYQRCFGGKLIFQTTKEKFAGTETVISACLQSVHVTIYGTDLVHEEGRKTGNHLAVFLRCENNKYRIKLAELLTGTDTRVRAKMNLLEITDAFGVRWILSV